MLLLDSNILIKAVYPGTKEHLFLVNSLKSTKIAISVISLAEILSGGSKKELEKIEVLLSQAKLLAIDEQVARKAAKIRRSSSKTKKTYLMDSLIAATAIIHSITLVTNDTDFNSIKDLKTYDVS